MTMSTDALWSFWSRYTRPSRRDAEALVGDRRKGFTTLASAAASYACNLAVAVKCRRDGDVNGEYIYTHAAKLALDRMAVGGLSVSGAGLPTLDEALPRPRPVSRLG